MTLFVQQLFAMMSSRCLHLPSPAIDMDVGWVYNTHSSTVDLLWMVGRGEIEAGLCCDGAKSTVPVILYSEYDLGTIVRKVLYCL
jgi:hypothetical protein